MPGPSSIPVPMSAELPSSSIDKRTLNELLRSAVTHASGRGHLSLLVLDIDHFKSINDAFGHIRGDQILAEFWSRVSQTLRPGDTAVRYGGDEFVILLPNTVKQQSLLVANRLLEAISSRPFAGEPPLTITISVGAASFPDEAPDAEGLFERADAHLYEAKRRGRGQVAGDGKPDAASSATQPLSRIVERDSALESAHSFLRAIAPQVGGLLELSGEPGTGRTRLLTQVVDAAGLLGYRTLHFRPTAALRRRMFGALVESRADWESAVWQGSEALLQTISDDHGARILFSIDDADHLDEEGIELLLEMATRVPGGAGVVVTCAPGTLPRQFEQETRLAIRERITLEPISPAGLRTWVRAALRWEPPTPFVAWLHRETAGRPARIHSGLGRLVELAVLDRGENGWHLDEQFEQHSLGAWLEAASAKEAYRVPSSMGTIVGRDRELREMKELVRGGRLMTLIGPGGFGKTRLAAQLASEMGGEFEDGAAFVALESVESVDQVPKAIARAVRCSLKGGNDPIQQIGAFLAPRRMLLVLDNFEHVMPAAPELVRLLDAAPALRIVVTSRESVSLRDEVLYPIEGMRLPAGDDPREILESTAVRLFGQRARRQTPDFGIDETNGRAIARICRHVEGSPLAIELAAALVRVLSCDEIIAEIEQDIEVLGSTAHDRPERHRSLRTVFDYSWGLLSERDRVLWSRLSVFPGGFTREAGAAVAGATLVSLVALVNKSLVARTSTGRYEIHDALRRFAAEKLAQDPAAHDRVRREMARFFAAFAFERGERRTSDEARRAVDEMAAELDNLRTAFAWSVRTGDAAEVERFVKGLFRYFDLSGAYLEGRELFRDAAGRVSDRRLRGLLLGRVAHFCFQLGEQAEAQRIHRRSIRLLRAAGSADEASLSIYGLGNIAYQQGEYAVAKRLYRRCASIYRRTRSSFGLALCLNDLGVIELLQGNVAGARRYFDRSLSIRRRIDDPAGVARCLNNLGMIADQEGRGGEARQCFERSLEAARAANDRRMVANALNNLGVFAQRTGETESSPRLLREAREFLLEALEAYTEISSHGGATLAIYNLGDIARMLGEMSEAEARLTEALVRAGEAGETPLVISTLISIARCLRARGDTLRALEILHVLVTDDTAIEEDRRVASTLIAELETELGPDIAADVQRTATTLSLDGFRQRFQAGFLAADSDAAECAPACEAPPLVPASATWEELIDEGRAAERAGRPAAARAYYEAALYTLRPGDPVHVAPALMRWITRMQLAEGDLAAAEDTLEASLAVAEAVGDAAALAYAVNLRGILSFTRGEIGDAAQHYLRARTLGEEIGEAKLIAMADQNLGVIANVHGDLAEAQRRYEQCLEGFRTLGADENVVEVLNNLGMLHTDRSRWAEAESAFDEAVRTCERLSSDTARLMVDVNRVELEIARRQFDRARAICDEAFEHASRLDDRRVLGELHKCYGIIFRETHQVNLAESHFGFAEKSAQDRSDLLLAAETAREQAELFWQLQRNQQTLEYLNRAHACFEQLRARRDLAQMHGRIRDFEHLFLETVRRWSDSIESVDPYTQGHCVRVADLACELARVAGVPEEEMFWFRIGALLHDLGKISVPAEILNKPGALSAAERTVIESHPDAGVKLLGDVEFPWDVRPMIRHHHERWDGSGYPAGLSGEGIPLPARILCIADVYDALTTDRPYRGGFDHERAIRMMTEELRGHFDPKLLALFRDEVLGSQRGGRRAAHLRIVRVA
jgi:diguanylate cyclase (GGDEF)-like protein/putative nucleotidyltransferase with HDIG domain